MQMASGRHGMTFVTNWHPLSSISAALPWPYFGRKVLIAARAIKQAATAIHVIWVPSLVAYALVSPITPKGSL